jgi:hypothetical protein
MSTFGIIGGVLFFFLCASSLPAAWQVRDQPELGRAIHSTQPIDAPEVSEPMRSTTRSGWVMHALDRRHEHVHVIQWYFRAYQGPTHGIAINTGTGETRQLTIPDNLQIHMAATEMAEDGRLYIITPWWYQAERKGMNLFVYDPTTMELEDRGVIAPKLGYEHRQLRTGTNGKIYGSSTYPGIWQAGAFELDPETGEVTDYGPFGPRYEPAVWTWGLGADDTHIYVYTVHNPRRLIALNRETRESEVLLTAKNEGGSIGIRQHRHGVSVTAKGLIDAGRDEGQWWLLKGKLIPRTNDTPPWDGPLDGEPRMPYPPAMVELFTENTMPTSDGHAEIWYRTERPSNVAEDASAEAQGWRVVRYQVPVYPVSTNYIIELDDGRIFGSSTGYHGSFFIYNPANGQTEVLGKLGGLSQYARIVHGGKVYMSGYPSSPLYIFDPAKPWTAEAWLEPGQKAPGDFSPENNPWFAARLREFAGTHYVRSVTTAADGKIYFGGHWQRDGAGGGLSWWDPQSQEAGGFWHELSNAAVTDLTNTDQGRLVIIATRPAPDRLLDKPMLEQARVFVFDTEKGEIVRHFDPLPGVNDLGNIAGAGGSRVLGIAPNPEQQGHSILYGFDAATGQRAFRRNISAHCSGDFRVGPDGNIWTFLGDALVCINPRNAEVQVAGKVRAGHIAFSGGDIYISGGERIRRVRNAYRP